MPKCCGIVEFNFETFGNYFPELQSSVSEKRAEINWRRAVNFIGSADDNCIINDYCLREEVLYDLTAFYIVLTAGAVSVSTGSGEGASNITAGEVGQVTNSHMGSVSMSFQSLSSENASYSEKFLSQNQFGAMAWSIIQRYLHGPIYEAPDPPYWSFPWP